jgi:hypothetical protein
MATRYVGIDDSNVTLQIGHPVFRIEAHGEIDRSEIEDDSRDDQTRGIQA